MLDKLLKYELQSTRRLFLPLFLATCIMALFARILTSIGFFQNGIMSIIPTFFMVLFVILLVATMIGSIIISIWRFYTNYTTDEGYLMFTLPVKVSNLIMSKLLISLLWIVASILVCIGALAIVFYGTSVWDALVSVLRLMNDEITTTPTLSPVLFYSMITIYSLVSIIYSIIFFYLSIALGQFLVPRHKILGTVLSYFALNVVSQIVTTVLFALYILCIGLNFDSNVIPASLFPFFTILVALLTVPCFLGTGYLLKNKLNLE